MTMTSIDDLNYEEIFDLIILCACSEATPNTEDIILCICRESRKVFAVLQIEGRNAMLTIGYTYDVDEAPAIFNALKQWMARRPIRCAEVVEVPPHDDLWLPPAADPDMMEKIFDTFEDRALEISARAALKHGLYSHHGVAG
jgi:hypothetical protein